MKIRKKVLSAIMSGLLLFSAAAVTTPVYAEEAEVFENGDFSDGANGWITEGSGWEVLGAFSDSGNPAMKFSGGAAENAALKHTLRVKKNTGYVISFMAQGVRKMQVSVSGESGSLTIAQTKAQGEKAKNRNDGGDGNELIESTQLGLVNASWWFPYEYYFNSGDNDEVVFEIKDTETSAFGEGRWFDNFVLTSRYENIINGDFEYTPDSFRYGGGWCYSVYNILTNANGQGEPAGGSRFAQLWGKDSTIYQPVNLEPNTNYEISVKYKKSSGGGDTTLGVQVATGFNIWTLLDADIADKDFICSDDWQEGKTSFNSGDNTMLYIGFVTKYTSNCPCIDDIKITRIAPKITAAYIDGFAAHESKLSAETKIEVPEGYEAGESRYRWQSADSADGTFEDIDGATGKEYTVKRADKYIRVGITPSCTNSDGVSAYGAEVFSNAVKAGDTTDTGIDLKGSFTGVLIADKDEALSCTDDADNFGGYVLNGASLREKLNESNAVECGNIWYGIALGGEKRAVKSNGESDIEISANNKNYSSVSVLMTYSAAPSEEQRIIINYADGTNTEYSYTAGLAEDAEGGVSPAFGAPVGLIDVNTGDEISDKGYVYSYTFETNPELEISSVVFPCETTEDKAIILAISGKGVSAEVLKKIIESKINALPEKITAQDRDKVEEIIKYGENLNDMGENAEEIGGYKEISDLIPEVKSCTLTSGLYNFVIDIEFCGNVLEDAVSDEMISLGGIDGTRYYIEPKTNGDAVNGAKITIINYFDYPSVVLNIKGDVKSAYAPNFNMAYPYSQHLSLREIVSAENVKCSAAANGTFSARADITNNSDEVQSYYAVCAVYSEENEMLGCIVKQGEISPNKKISINENGTFTGTAARTAVFIWNNAEEMKLIYR